MSKNKKKNDTTSRCHVLPLVYQPNEKKKKKQKCNQTCKFAGCKNHNGIKNITFHHVPKPATEKSKPKPSDRIEKFIRYHSKNFQHKEFLRKMGFSSKKYNYQNTRICSAHKRLELVKTMKVERLIAGEMKSQQIKFTYEAPQPCGIKSTLIKNKQDLKRKNTARERRHLSEWENGYENMKEEVGEKVAKDFTQLATSYQQMIEDQSPSKKRQANNDGTGLDPYLSPLGLKLHESTKHRGFK